MEVREIIARDDKFMMKNMSNLQVMIRFVEDPDHRTAAELLLQAAKMLPTWCAKGRPRERRPARNQEGRGLGRVFEADGFWFRFHSRNSGIKY